MENLPFGNFEVGDIVGIWSEGEMKMIYQFLILRKVGKKLFGNPMHEVFEDCFPTKWVVKDCPEIELEHPEKYIKVCSVNLKQDVNSCRV